MLRAPVAPCICNWDGEPEASFTPHITNPECQVHGDLEDE
jgi:hypothetical protein